MQGKDNITRITAFTRYSRMGASSRLRTYQFVPKLKEAGYEVEVLPLFGDTYLKQMYGEGSKSPLTVLSSYSRRIKQLFFQKSGDLIWIEKELFPFLPAWFEDILLSTNMPIVVDYDDAIFHNYDQHSSRFIRSVLGKKIAKVINSADCVLCGNHYLAEYAEDASASNIVHLPTVVDTSRYPVKSYKEIDKNKPVTIGWIGSPSTVPYLEQLVPVFEQLAQKYAIQLKVVGGKLNTDANLNIINEQWSEQTEAQSIRTFDIGVMPLEESKWARGKCAYKLIQYMVSGLPAVGSDFGANSDVVLHEKTGYLANTEEEWYRYLEILINNKQQRKQMGMAGRARVEEYYSLKTASRLLIKVFDSLTNK